MADMIQVATIPEVTPLELWGGFDGKGFDKRLYLATGLRFGGTSSIFSTLAGRTWDLELQTVAETINKMRDGPDPNGGAHKLFAFIEGPHAQPGLGLVGYRDLGSPGWGMEGGVSVFGNTVGGRGLAVGSGGLFAGGARNWNSDRDGFLQQKNSGGGWGDVRTHTPGLLWEAEFDGDGRLWEFWNDFGGVAGAHTYRAGEEVGNPPGEDISQAVWGFNAMYVTGNLSSGDPSIYRYIGEWERVHSFPSGSGDHLIVHPKGRMYATAQNPLQVARTDDGLNWSILDVPAIETGSDTNHLTGLAFFRGKVWVAAKSPDGIIIMREPGSLDGEADDILQLQVS